MGAYRYLILVVLFLITSESIAFANQSVTLGSGKSVEIIAAGPLQSTQGWSALMVKYKTAIPLSDMASLCKEANEIWNHFMPDAEHAGYRQGIISANEPEEGWIITHNQSYNFVFEKKDNSWQMIDAQKHCGQK